MDDRDAAREHDTSIPQPGLRCWFCGERLDLQQLLSVGILRSREEERGGPYRLFYCPGCNRTNHCERTPKGRWFSSPDFQPNLLDYLVGRLLVGAPEDFLQAASWFRENEERRRFFFERDGDLRYAGRSGLFSRLWRSPPAADAEAKKPAPEPDASRRRPRPEGRERRTRPRAARLMTPWEILGVPRDADRSAVRSAFHRLAVQYHPDKVHHMGEEFQKVAHEKFTELQRAYETLLGRLEKRS